MEPANLFDIYPTQSQFGSGQEVHLNVEMTGCTDEASVEIEVYQRQRMVQAVSRTVGQIREHRMVVSLGNFDDGGYRVVATLHTERMRVAKTAFDVRKHWRETPRYSFLSDYGPRGSYQVIQNFFLKFHLNVVQFYDWMERHDALVPKTPEFVDPMGRKVATEGILSRIAAMRDIGLSLIHI